MVRSGGWKCRQRVRKASREYMARVRATPEGRERLRGAKLMSSFGVTLAQYQEMYVAQAGGCAICGGDNGKRNLAVDHDRACCPGNRSCGKCVRGLLCDSCNNGLGRFRDDPEILQRAIDYLGAKK